MALGILNPNDPGLFRAQRGGLMGADALMVPDVGTGGRYISTTGEAGLPASPALGNDWRNILDPHGPGFALLALGVILFMLNGARVAVDARAGLGRK